MSLARAKAPTADRLGRPTPVRTPLVVPIVTTHRAIDGVARTMVSVPAMVEVTCHTLVAMMMPTVEPVDEVQRRPSERDRGTVRPVMETNVRIHRIPVAPGIPVGVPTRVAKPVRVGCVIATQPEPAGFARQILVVVAILASVLARRLLELSARFGIVCQSVAPFLLHHPIGRSNRGRQLVDPRACRLWIGSECLADHDQRARAAREHREQLGILEQLRERLTRELGQRRHRLAELDVR